MAAKLETTEKSPKSAPPLFEIAESIELEPVIESDAIDVTGQLLADTDQSIETVVESQCNCTPVNDVHAADCPCAPTPSAETTAIEVDLDAGGIVEETFTLQVDRRGDIYSEDQIIDAAFEWFRATGFPYKKLPKFAMMQQINSLAQTEMATLGNTVEAYGVADTFHPHRFHVTVDGKVSPLQCFLDDVKFRWALYMRRTIRQENIPAGFFGELTLARGTQQCSNFRPGFACMLYRRYCNTGATVLDTSTGYGGRLVGFVASRLNGTYIGIDPNTDTHHANIAMARDLGVGDHVRLFNAPVEDLDPQLFREQCDFAFSSPPYFSKEHYSESDTQSWKRYGHSFDAWVNGFLRPMLLLTFHSLKPDCHAIINIEDVKIRNKKYPLVDRTIKSALSVGFRFTGDESFRMQQRVGANQEEAVATERVLRFLKPS